MSDNRMIARTADGQLHELTVGDPLPTGTIEVYQNSGAALNMAIENGVTFTTPNGITITVPDTPEMRKLGESMAGVNWPDTPK